MEQYCASDMARVASDLSNTAASGSVHEAHAAAKLLPSAVPLLVSSEMPWAWHRAATWWQGHEQESSLILSCERSTGEGRGMTCGLADDQQ